MNGLFTGFRPIVFLMLSVLLLAGLLMLQSAPVSDDPFADNNSGRLALLDKFPTKTLLQIKLAHAKSNPAYKVGLFGNSRAVAVNSDDIGISGQQFFNFSIPGTSIRQSVLFLEQLNRIDKAPEIAFISFDNFELQYFPNPSYPLFPQRLFNGLADVFFGFRIGDFRDAFRMLKRVVIIEWKAIKRTFNFDLLMINIRYRWAVTDNSTERPLFALDGSRSQQLKQKKKTIDGSSFGFSKPNILLNYIQRDLSKLVGIKSQVIIYESPLHPDIASKFLSSPSAYAANTRKQFVKVCKKLSLRCLTAPVLNKTNMLWIDGSHAPGPVLGAYLSNLLTKGNAQ